MSVRRNSNSGNGFWPKAERDSYIDQARDLGAKVELHYLPLDKEMLWERLDNRNGEMKYKTFIISRSEQDEWHDLFESPTKEEMETYDAFHVYK